MSIAAAPRNIVVELDLQDAVGRVLLGNVSTPLHEGDALTLRSGNVLVDATAQFSAEENSWVAEVAWNTLRTTTPPPAYEHLAPRRSAYQQLFLRGRRTRAEVIYRYTVGPEPRTPEEVARDCDIPVEMVLECVDYAVNNKPLLDAERASEESHIRRSGLNRWPYAPREASEPA